MLMGKPVKGGEGMMLKLICASHNHKLTNTLVGHPCAGRLIGEEKFMLVNMTNNSMKTINILLTMKEHNEKNVMTIKQIYNARYSYRKTSQGHRTEIQQLMFLLKRDMYVHYWVAVDKVIDNSIVKRSN